MLTVGLFLLFQPPAVPSQGPPQDTASVSSSDADSASITDSDEESPALPTNAPPPVPTVSTHIIIHI